MAPKACGERQEIYHTVGGTYAEALVTMCDGGNARNCQGPGLSSTG